MKEKYVHSQLEHETSVVSCAAQREAQNVPKQVRGPDLSLFTSNVAGLQVSQTVLE